MNIDSGTMVRLQYELLDSDGDLVEDSTDEPVTYRHGDGDILPGLERALIGHRAGDEVTVELPAADAFGEYDPEGLQIIPRKEFPPDAELVPGDAITLQFEGDEDGEIDEVDALIVEISPESISIDMNHPLAGQDVTFRVKVLEVWEGDASANGA